MNLQLVNLKYISAYPNRTESALGASWFTEHFDYNPESGKFFYRKQGANKKTVPGKEAVPTKMFKYQSEIFWRGKAYHAARVAYICMTQKIPHIVLPKNGDITDLRWDNLLHITRKEQHRIAKRVDMELYNFDLTKLNH